MIYFLINQLIFNGICCFILLLLSSYTQIIEKVNGFIHKKYINFKKVFI